MIYINRGSLENIIQLAPDNGMVIKITTLKFHQDMNWFNKKRQYIGREMQTGELSFYLQDFLETGKIS